MSTEDHLLLQSAKKKELQVKKDERIVNKVEYVQEKIEALDMKEQHELDKVEASRDYYRKEIHLADEYLEREIQKLRDAYDRKIKYYKEALINLDTKEDSIREKYDQLREKKSEKVDRLANKITTGKGKQLLGEVVENKVMYREVTQPKSETQEALEYFSGTEYRDLHSVGPVRFPNWYKKTQETIRQQEKERLTSPKILQAKIQAENELLADELKRKEAEKQLAQLNRQRQNAELDYKAAKAQGLPQEKIEEFLNLFESAHDIFTRRKLEYERGIY